MGRHAKNSDNTTDKEAGAQAINVLAKGGRSFYWASHFLGKKTTYDAAHLYRFCRILDDLADGDLANGPARLKAINAQLHALAKGQSLSEIDPALDAFMPTLHACSVPISPIQHLLDGLLFDQRQVAIKTQDELIKYAYQVAGTVGLLMCPILGCQDRRAFLFAVDMGIAMQLTNIARDILEDAQMGRRYLPADWVNHLSASAICASASQPDGAEAAMIKSAIDTLLCLADRYYESGRKGLVYLPLRAHISIAVAGNIYREIGQKLRRRQLDWTKGRTITSKTEKTCASLAAFSSLPARITSMKPSYGTDLQHALEGYLERQI